MQRRLGLAVIHDQLVAAAKSREEHRTLYLQESHDPKDGPLILTDHWEYIEEPSTLEVALAELANLYFPGEEIKKGKFSKWKQIATLEKFLLAAALNSSDLSMIHHRPLDEEEKSSLKYMNVLVHHFRRQLEENFRREPFYGSRMITFSLIELNRRNYAKQHPYVEMH